MMSTKSLYLSATIQWRHQKLQHLKICSIKIDTSTVYRLNVKTACHIHITSNTQFSL